MTILIFIFALVILTGWLLVDNDIAQDDEGDYWDELERRNYHD